MQNDSEIIQHIYKSRVNLLKQLKNVSYNTDAYENSSITEVSHMHKNDQLDMVLKKPNQTLYCKYLLNKSLRVSYIEEIIEELFNIRAILTNNDSIILVTQHNGTDTIKQYLRKLFTDRNYYISNRTLAQLQFNILDHTLVPKHTILTETSIKDMQTRYNLISSEALPEISRFDPVSKALMLKPGEIVHIERPSKTAITGDYYRVCINK
jgi:DNA-directed RNA polymerase subunit H (RpoH/RPB5)